MAVDIKQEGRVVIFTINRPEKRNAMNNDVHHGLYDGMLAFRDDPELWVAIITGAGDVAFSAGEDVFAGREGRRASCLNRADKIRKPFIAAINGYALGGGLELALSCDLRIMAEHATLGLPEVTIGQMPMGGGTQRLPRFIPRAVASWMLLTGEPITAEEAYRVGLVNKVVPLEQLMPTVMQLAQAMCQKAPLAMRAVKEAMLLGYNVSLEEGILIERNLGMINRVTEDAQEGPKALGEKRPPQFQGKYFSPIDHLWDRI